MQNCAYFLQVSFPKGTTEHPINKSGKCNILVSVWDFGAVHPQSERSYYICNDHPAKMRPPLARAILQLYGESPVLDPMAGIGTTLVEAMLLGMNTVGIEFEKKFVDQANKNIEHVKKLFPNKNLGKAVCIQGDARDLSLNKVNSIIFSPPYFNAIKKGDEGPHATNKRTSYRDRINRFQGYSDNEGNIGNVSKFGSIVLSPPYFDALSVTKCGGSKKSALCEESTQELQMKRSGPFAVKKNLPTPYSSKLGNIGNISEFGSIIFSPPYCGVMDAKRHVGGIAARDSSLAKTGSYSQDESNLGNIRSYGEKFSSIIFSPPYSDAVSHSKLKTKIHTGYHKWEAKKEKTINLSYSEDKNNIGNLKCRTYLGEMFKVYSECFHVLKPGKFMVVVVKDIRRKGLTIPLGCDTVKLLQLAGFEIFDIIVNKMYFPSFWQLTHAQKTQAKRIPMSLRTHEYVIVARKPNAKNNPNCDFKCYKCRYDGFCAIQRRIYEQDAKRKNSNQVDKYKLNVLPDLHYKIFRPLFDKNKKPFSRYRKRSKYNWDKEEF